MEERPDTRRYQPGERRLPDASGADQRDEPLRYERVLDLSNVILATK